MAETPHSDAPPLALTMGEPAGVGGELSLRAWATARDQTGPFFAIDDPARLAALAERLGGGVMVEEIAAPAEAATVFARALPVLAEPLAAPVEPGKPDTVNAGAVVNSIERATRLALDGTAAGLVTNPIQKSVLYAAGFEHPGHTEFVAKLCGDVEPVMMLACEALRAVPVTVHVSLRQAVDSLATETIVRKGRITVKGSNRNNLFIGYRLCRRSLQYSGLPRKQHQHHRCDPRRQPPAAHTAFAGADTGLDVLAEPIHRNSQWR